MKSPTSTTILLTSGLSVERETLSLRSAASMRAKWCRACGEPKLLTEMRFPGQSRGKTPSHCQACREANPDLRWCDYHDDWHPAERFTPTHGRMGDVRNDCIEAQSIKMSEAKGFDPRSCPVCKVSRPSHRFRGGREKAVACKSCEAEHPEGGWCRGCAAWLTLENFTKTERGMPASRCKRCHGAYNHGTTVAALLVKQAIDAPCCAACGSTESLKIDHDHDHCPGDRGCAECCRGWLCHWCNASEGMLKTSKRATLLAAYMQRWGK